MFEARYVYLNETENLNILTYLSGSPYADETLNPLVHDGIKEYMRYMYLKQQNPAYETYPSFSVNMVWEAHMRDAERYLTFCQRHFKAPVSPPPQRSLRDLRYKTACQLLACDMRHHTIYGETNLDFWPEFMEIAREAGPLNYN